MSTNLQRVAAPALPTTPAMYSRSDSTHFRNILRLFFNQLAASVNISLDSVRPCINTQTGTTYTLTEQDEHDVVLCTNGSAITVTVPPNMPEGYRTEVWQQGAGQVTLAAGSGVTLNNASSLLSRAQFSQLFIVNVGTDEYNVSGDMQ